MLPGRFLKAYNPGQNMHQCLQTKHLGADQGLSGICSARGRRTSREAWAHFFSFPPVGSFDAGEVRLHGDHPIAVHLQNAEDMFIRLIAKPRNQETVIKVWGHHGDTEKGDQPPRGWDRGHRRNFHGDIVSSEYSKREKTLHRKGPRRL